MDDLDNQLEQVLAQADKDRAIQNIDQDMQRLYPSLVQLEQERAASKTPPDWDSDPRTLESAMYPSMRKVEK
jgi:hypothetical protein